VILTLDFFAGKAIWNLWSIILIDEDLVVTAVIAHVVGMSILLLIFSFRGAVLPPMIITEVN
jgi:hypothetical protein